MDKKEKEALLSLLAARFFAYNLLKRAFLEEPTTEFLEVLKKDELFDFFPGREKKEVKEGADLASLYLKESPLDKNTMGDVIGDYNALFTFAPPKKGKRPAALYDKDNAPPYESVYLSTKPLTFQEETVAVRREYMKYGLVPKDFLREPDDHIGLELDFMGFLGKKTLDLLEKENLKEAKKLLGAQRRFLQTHLLKWVPKFSTQILKGAETNFYRGIGKLLKGYLEWDKRELQKLIHSLEELEEAITS